MNKLRFLTHPFFWGGLALLTFLFLKTPWVYPGEAAELMAHLTGSWSASAAFVTAHPLVSLLFGALGALVSPTIAVPLFNTLSAIAGALCVLLLCQIVKHCIVYFVNEPRTQPYCARAIRGALPITALTAILSVDFLRAATHFQWETFNLFFALNAVFLLLFTARTGSKNILALSAFVWGLLSLESTTFLLCSPFFVLALLLVYCNEQECIHAKPLFTHLLLPLIFGTLLTFLLIIAQWSALEPDTALRAILSQIAHRHLASAVTCLNGPWILVLLTGILPGILTLLTLRETGRNHRSKTLLFTYTTTLVFAALAILPQPLATCNLLSHWGNSPVLFAALTAFAFGGLTAISIFFIAVKQPPEATEERVFTRTFARFLGLLSRLTLPLLLLISGVTLTLSARMDEHAFATLPREYCDTILEAANENETWLLSDGVADIYLSLRIAQRNLPVTLFSLAQDKHPNALKQLQHRLEVSPYFSSNPALQEMLTRSLDVGMVPFIQDWLRNDAAANQHFVTLGLPDLWYTGNRLPLPQTLWYRGANTRQEQHEQLPNPGDIALEAANPELPDSLPASLKTFVEYVHRQRGFIANNVAFYLADAGKLEAAYALFDRVYTHDKSNVSALFNLFELINGGLHPENRAWCEQEVEQLIRKMRGQRYRLWALARTYGYIRSPQLISMLAGSWAMSGQTGAALSGLDLALAMLDDGQKVALNKAIADLCMSDPSRRKEAITRYQALLRDASDSQKSLAYTKELVRMHILENDLEAAKRLLEQMDATGDNPDLAYERALWLSSAGQPENARAALQKALDHRPRHLEALSLLATLQLQAKELDLLASATLPKLKTAAGTEDNYFVQIILAQLAEQKNQLEKARAAYLRALALKPEVHALRSTILTLDIRLNDKSSAERHAKQFLYQDRAHPLANYIMGSLALGNGDAKRALSYLSVATDASVRPPLPEAFNDLAEAHRQLGDWSAALVAAQHSCALSPHLAIARETAAAALLELGRYKEAHAYLDEAFTIEQRAAGDRAPDPRLYITRARLHLKEQHPDLARVALAEAKKQYDALDTTARKEFDKLADEVRLH